MSNLFQHSLATSTWQVYRIAFNSYNRFCQQSGLPVMPVTEHTLLFYVTHISTSLSYGTIKSYLAGIQFMSVRFGYPCAVSSMSQLYYILRGVRRFYGQSRHRPKRLPFTVNDCYRFLSFLQSSTLCPLDRKMLWSAITLAFFGLLRSAEFTANAIHRFDPTTTLLMTNITISPDLTYVCIVLRGSKTDPFKVGCTIRVGSTNNQLCPVSALHHYITTQIIHTGPLFKYHNGSYLTRNRLATLLHTCFPNQPYNTHSLRIGGASTMASAGIPDSQIMIMGRWSSNAYQRYIRLSDNLIKQSTTLMSQTNLLTKSWDPDILVSTFIS